MELGARALHNQRVLVKIATDGCLALQRQIFTLLKLQVADLSILVFALRVPLFLLSGLFG